MTNQEEIYCCPECRVPVEYIPEFKSYICGRCEKIFDKSQLRTSSQLQIKLAKLPMDNGRPRPPMGELL